MSKPRYGWWGYVKWMIRQYPAREGRYMQGKALEISIHAPREGSDGSGHIVGHIVGVISIHAPREGSDSKMY